jgi:hypothetical protein
MKQVYKSIPWIEVLRLEELVGVELGDNSPNAFDMLKFLLRLEMSEKMPSQP